MASLIKYSTDLNLFVLLMWAFTGICQTITEEICTAEVFEARCNPKQVILIKSATYGRMKIGRCVKRDLGYLGCSSDATETMDTICSGKQECELIVSNTLRKEVPGSCMEAIVGYAEINYECENVAQLTQDSCQGGEIFVTSTQTLIASSTIQAICPTTRHLQIVASPGQTMNISLWNFGSERRQVYGVFRDPVSSNSVELALSSRFQNKLTSMGHVVEVNLNKPISENANFLIQVQVSGCADMSPPDGAWMTRDGDVMEVGCHSGPKSWSMKCVNNQWRGVLGYCGTDTEQIHVEDKGETTTALRNVSLNVLVFGLCSLVILLSACIFMAGVIILKRKLTPKDVTNYPMIDPQQGHPLFIDEQMAAKQVQQNTMNFRGGTTSNSACYKSLQGENYNANV